MPRFRDLLGVLVVSSGESAQQKLCEKLDNAVFEPICVARDQEEARRIMLHTSFDIVIINSPINREPGHELALDITESSNCAVLLLTKHEDYDETRYRVESSGVLTLPKPFSNDMFLSTLNLCIATRYRIKKSEDENKKLRAKLDEIRLVNKAKWVLSENCSMSENEAHRFIEKSAMDRRITRSAVANEILKEYD